MACWAWLLAFAGNNVKHSAAWQIKGKKLEIECTHAAIPKQHNFFKTSYSVACYLLHPLKLLPVRRFTLLPFSGLHRLLFRKQFKIPVMKKIIFSLVSSVLMLSTYSQAINPDLSREDYLQKSYQQKSAGWVLLAGGMGLMVASAATYKLDFNFYWGGDPYSNPGVDNTASTALALAGTAALVGSIVVFTSARHNRRKAHAVSLTMQKVDLPQYNRLLAKTQPAIQLRIPL
jgi:hypothetical protein